MLERIHELVESRSDFGFETTLSGLSYARLLQEIKSKGYRVVLFFLWLPDADIAVSRVANRVRQGGHNIPETVIRRRYESGLRNLFQLYRPLLDDWWLYDASHTPPFLFALEKEGTLTVLNPDLFDSVQRNALER